MKVKNKKYYRELFSSNDWSFKSIEEGLKLCEKVAKEYLDLDFYPNQVEIVNSEQMLDAYALTGLPISYPHWKFGKDFSINSNNYQKGKMGLSYEMVINSNPCISYNMENNSTCMMMLVLAHACIGHNNFFKENYMFKEWTDADSIVDFLKHSREFILECEELYGPDRVEYILDCCHSLMDYGIDKHKKPNPKSMKEENERLKKIKEFKSDNYNELWKTLPSKISWSNEAIIGKKDFPENPEENILYFIEKYSSKLKDWERQIIRIVRYISQYFYPQGQTKVSNEGWASFIHYKIINKLYEDDYLDDGFMLEFIKSHSSVLYQPDYDSKAYYGLNPYALGFNIYRDIERICKNPTEEDKKWFPDLIGKNWLEECKYAMENFRDDSFILQYLSPKVMRDMKLFSILDEEKAEEYKISNIHDDRGYHHVRKLLADTYNRSLNLPDIKVEKTDLNGDRKLILTHISYNDKKLNKEYAESTMYYLKSLWGFPAVLYSIKGSDKSVLDVF